MSKGRCVRPHVPHLRSIAYHHFLPGSEQAFRAQLSWLSRRYYSLTDADLDQFFAGAQSYAPQMPPPQMPLEQGAAAAQSCAPLIISFDDGLRAHYAIAAPLLEEYGFRGWFFVAAGLPGLDTAAQLDFCRNNALLLPKTCAPEASAAPAALTPAHKDDGRPAMNWDELRDLRRRGHVIGCHTMGHHRFHGEPDDAVIQKEIFKAKEVIEQNLHEPITSFAWVGGEPDTYAGAVYRALGPAGFRAAFTTLSAKAKASSDPLCIHRTVLEPDMPFVLFWAKLTLLSDLRHTVSRRRLAASLAGASHKEVFDA